jgi:protein arginine N-methyltransferase 5
MNYVNSDARRHNTAARTYSCFVLRTSVDIRCFPSCRSRHRITLAFARSLHFVVVPLVHPRLERRGLGGGSVSGARQFTRSDLVLTGEQWSRHVVGALSDWAIANLESPALRVDAARVLHQELSWAQHLSLPAVQVGLRSINCAALAGCLNSFLTNMS